MSKPVQLTNEGWAPATGGQPRAQREQATSSEWDDMMLILARERHAQISWWWGYRHVDGLHWAVCYVCDTQIIRVKTDRGLSDERRAAILDHRNTHYTEMRNRRAQ